MVDAAGKDKRRVFRLMKTVVVKANQKTVTEVGVLEITSRHEIDRIIDGTPEIDAKEMTSDFTLRDIDTTAYSSGADKKGVYVTGPGPDEKAASDEGFLPLSLAISFFFMWAISGAGQPSSMVRLMAFNSTQTLRRSIFTVAIYYSMIYFPLVIIFTCARILMPGMEAETDRIMPAMAVLPDREHRVRLAGRFAGRCPLRRSDVDRRQLSADDLFRAGPRHLSAEHQPRS